MRIGAAQFRELEEVFLGQALTLPAEVIGGHFRALPFEPYGPVKQQLRKLLSKVNRARGAAGLERVPFDYLRTRRQTVSPFAAEETSCGSVGPSG